VFFTFRKIFYIFTIIIIFVAYTLISSINYESYKKKFSNDKYWAGNIYSIKNSLLYNDFDYSSYSENLLKDLIFEALDEFSPLSRSRNRLAFVIDYYCHNYKNEQCKLFLKKYLKKAEFSKLSGRYAHMLNEDLKNMVADRLTIPDRHFMDVMLAKNPPPSLEDDFFINYLGVFAQSFFEPTKFTHYVIKNNKFVIQKKTSIIIPKSLDITINSNKKLKFNCKEKKEKLCGFSYKRTGNDFTYRRFSETINQEINQPSTSIILEQGTEIVFKQK